MNLAISPISTNKRNPSFKSMETPNLLGLGHKLNAIAIATAFIGSKTVRDYAAKDHHHLVVTSRSATLFIQDTRRKGIKLIYPFGKKTPTGSIDDKTRELDRLFKDEFLTRKTRTKKK